jgi:hypothetical protein
MIRVVSMQQRSVLFLVTLGFVMMAVGRQGYAEEVASVYTKIDLAACQVLSAPSAEDSTIGGSWMCTGYQGQPVYVAEGDLRMFVAFGADAANEPAATQTLQQFNTINETLEWRLRGGVPFATILRWFPSGDDGTSSGSVLIVTQLLPGGGTCQIARIDARANKNANVLARQAADALAGQFNCNAPPQVMGNPGSLAN